MTPERQVFYLAVFAVFCTVVPAGCATAQQQEASVVPEIRPGILAGYLPQDGYPNSKALLPLPPAAGSAAMARDEEASTKSLALRGTSRWALAKRDAALMFPEAAVAFACAVDATISEAHTPHLYMLLRRSLADAGLSTYAAKNSYQRKRPFTVNKEPICTPEEEAHLRTDGSYPSGHTAIGWAWALILTEIAPDRTDAILARGRAFGQSRVVCNVHWQSDVIAGRFVGAAVVARLHADPVFVRDLEKAKKELVEVRAQGLKPSHDCQAEVDVQGSDLETRP